MLDRASVTLGRDPGQGFPSKKLQSRLRKDFDHLTFSSYWEPRQARQLFCDLKETHDVITDTSEAKENLNPRWHHWALHSFEPVSLVS